MPVILDTPEAVVIHGPWQETLAVARERGGVDAVVTDCPYSAKTHAAYDDMPDLDRAALAYASWAPDDVRACVAEWAPAVRGWWVSLTDDVLAPEWRTAYEAAGLYAFRSVPCVISGMTVRLAGDGPSSESVFAQVARPSSFVRWRTLPGYYLGKRERQTWTGGKPPWLMTSLVRDYTKRGDLVADFCSGGGTTAKAARILGRRFIGGDIDETAARETARVVSAAREQLPLALGAE